MFILGIETSCDETACGIVEDGVCVHASIVASQVARHAQFGGVVPEIAAREHLSIIDRLVSEALNTSNLKLSQMNAIAVTQGPGLIGALLVGVSYARGLAFSSRLPLIPVDHVHAHVHGAMLGLEASEAENLFPCLSLVVSGGHTNLYYMEAPNRFEQIARSVDDACGESFDKVAKLLGLPYPGGPQIEKLARGWDPKSVPMPQMVESRSKLFFSYSGLKTHVAQLIKNSADSMSEKSRGEICSAFQEAALGQIVRKLKVAIDLYPNARSILVAGGVSANTRFREWITKEFSQRAVFPPLALCADNGAMIAASAYFMREQESPEPFSWDAYSRYAHQKN